MIDFNNLIDMLPYYFKENDSYKVDGKGILQRFLDICGEYFKDQVYADTKSILDIQDLDKTPDMYLVYFWELLGQMPFAIGNHIDEEAWKTNFNGLLGDSELERLSKTWIIPKSGPFSLTSEEVRSILRYSISLLKIRGSKDFFEIIFRMYGLTCEIEDPTKTGDYNGWLTPEETKPRFDQYVYFDKGHFDNQYECTQCIPVKFTIGGHTFSDKYQSGFNSFRRGVENIINRFKPFNVSFTVDYGFEFKDEFTIQAEFVDPNINSIIIGGNNKVPIQVTLTSDYAEADLRYQVMYKSSEDKLDNQWGYTKHENGSIYIATVPGIYYFRSVADPEVITSLVVGAGDNLPTYRISADPRTLRITPETPNPSTIIKASVVQNGKETDLIVRRSGTDETKPSGQAWSFSEPGSYVFEISDQPNYKITILVTKQENIYTVICNPESVSVDITELETAKTKLTISDLYGTPGLQCYEQSNPNTLYNNGDIFTADGFKQYIFICTLDTTKSGNLGKFLVNQISTYYQYILNGPDKPLELNAKEEAYADLTLLVSPKEDGSQYINNQVDIYYQDILVETLALESAEDENYTKFIGTYTCINPGQYRAVCKGDSTVSVIWTVTPYVKPQKYIIYIQPVDVKEVNPDGTSPWTPDYYNNDIGLSEIDKSLATYQMLNDDSVARFMLMANFDMEENNTVTCDQTGKTYKVNDPDEIIELNEPGDYIFFSEYFLNSAKLTVKDFPLVVEITASKERDTLTPDKDSVSTTITCTSNHRKFDTSIQLLGSEELHESPYEFTTNRAGDYTFMAAYQKDVRVVYQVDIDFTVTPEEIIWEAADLDSKQITINTGGSQEWNITQS